MSKVLVAGGAGFLGSHLCEALLARGEEVICLDNLYTGTLQNIAHLQSSKNFTFLEGDVREPFEEKVDFIYNLASPASPVHYQQEPVLTITTNFLGSLQLLEKAKRDGIGIFQASTSEVYGDPAVHPQVESYWGNVNPIGIRSCYDEGKRAAETLFFDFHREYGVDIKVARIFNTYGPRMAAHDGRVVSNFITRAIKNEPIEVYGTGSQTRSFCYVSDLIEVIIKIAGLPNGVTGPFNIGNPNEFTMLELAENVIELSNSESQVIHLPLPQDDPTRRKPDITAINEITQWRPKVELREGLSKTITYFLEDHSG